jgi:hypothetical protein
MWDKLFSILGGNVFEGVKDIVRTFKLPPEQQLQFDAKIAELQTQAELKLAELEAEDRNSARNREIQVKGNTPAILAFSITAGFFSVLLGMMFVEIPISAKDVLYVMVGSLGTAWTGVIAYYFGSSAGSAAKHELIEKLTK